MSNYFLDPNIAHDPVAMLRDACAKAGSQKAWADAHGVSSAYVCDVLSGRREPGDSILAALKLRKVVTYLLTKEEWQRRDRNEAHGALLSIRARLFGAEPTT